MWPTRIVSPLQSPLERGSHPQRRCQPENSCKWVDLVPVRVLRGEGLLGVPRPVYIGFYQKEEEVCVWVCVGSTPARFRKTPGLTSAHPSLSAPGRPHFPGQLVRVRAEDPARAHQGTVGRGLGCPRTPELSGKPPPSRRPPLGDQCWLCRRPPSTIEQCEGGRSGDTDLRVLRLRQRQQPGHLGGTAQDDRVRQLRLENFYILGL